MAELAPRLDLREDLALLGENARAGVPTETLYAWGERKPLLERSWFRVLAWGLSVLGSTAVIAFLAYLLVYFGILKLPQTTVAGLQLYFLSLGMIYSAVLWRFKGRTHTIIHELANAAPDLSLIAGVLGRLETERFNSPLLAMLRTQLEVDGQPPSMRIARLFRLVELVDSRKNMAMVVIRPLLLWDIHLSYAIEEWRRVSGPAMRRWLSAAGEMEALESIAGYYYEHPDDVFPEFLAEQPYFEGKRTRPPVATGRLHGSQRCVSGSRPERTGRERLQHVRQEYAASRHWYQHRAGSGWSAGPRTSPAPFLACHRCVHSNPGFASRQYVSLLCRDHTAPTRPGEGRRQYAGVISDRRGFTWHQFA